MSFKSAISLSKRLDQMKQSISAWGMKVHALCNTWVPHLHPTPLQWQGSKIISPFTKGLQFQRPSIVMLGLGAVHERNVECIQLIFHSTNQMREGPTFWLMCHCGLLLVLLKSWLGALCSAWHVVVLRIKETVTSTFLLLFGSSTLVDRELCPCHAMSVWKVACVQAMFHCYLPNGRIPGMHQNSTPPSTENLDPTFQPLCEISHPTIQLESNFSISQVQLLIFPPWCGMSETSAFLSRSH